jgi:hypothetical protein
MQRDEMGIRFTYHRPSKEQTKRMALIREKCGDLAKFIEANVPASREASLAITHLEEVSMWANAGIAGREVEANVPASREKVSMWANAGIATDAEGGCLASMDLMRESFEAQLAAKDAALEEAREALRNATFLECKGCGIKPTDPGFKWCADVPNYWEAHLIDGPEPEYCGPMITKDEALAQDTTALAEALAEIARLQELVI